MADAPRDYGIGTVSSLTGIDAHTLRAWERRHRAVVPGRSESGRRLYGDADVGRLRLLKAATEAGHAIGRIAARPDAELRALLDRHRAGPERTGRPLRVALRAPELARQIAVSPGACAWEVVAADGIPPEAELVILELGALGADPVRTVRDARREAPHATFVLLYVFARRALLARLGRLGCHLVRAPVGLPALERSVDTWCAPVPHPTPAGAAETPGAETLRLHTLPVDRTERRFDDEQLARLLETPGNVTCECPSHMASLVRSALAFESYARDCEDLTEEDAAIHRQLGSGVARVRAQLERLLQHLCAHEGMRI